MSLSQQTIEHFADLFAPLGAITTRRMMGGLCLYSDGQIFAILDRYGTPYLRAKGAFADDLSAAGATQFGAESGKTMKYWTLPDDALDDEEAARDWARRALAATG